MSGTNGTSIATPLSSTKQANEPRFTGAGDTARDLEDTAPLDVVDRPGTGETPTDRRALVRELAERLAVAEDVVQLTASPALVQHMTADEVDAEREVARLRREAARDYARWEIARDLKARKRQTRSSAVRRWLDRRAESSDQKKAIADRRWHLRAQRVRKRMTSTDARIASQIRASALWSNLLIGLMIVGLAYTGVVVQRNFVPNGVVTDPLYWLSLGLEAMCSVALMALMRHDARAALAGITRQSREVAWGWVVKATLLLASLAAAAGPSLMAGDGMGLIRTGWAPVLVAAVLLIHERISRGDSQILATLHADAERGVLQDLVITTEFAVRQGLIGPSQDNRPGEVAPSASKIASLHRISKESAAQVRVAVNERAICVTG